MLLNSFFATLWREPEAKKKNETNIPQYKQITFNRGLIYCNGAFKTLLIN